MIHTGLVSITFRKLSPPEVVGLVQQAGLDGIEWGGDIHVPHGDLAAARETARLTREAGLNVAAYGSYYRAGVSEAQGLSFQSVLDSALALGAPLIRVWAGNKGSESAEESDIQRVADDCRRISEQAAAAGVGVSLEYHGHTLTDTADAASNLIRKVDHDNLKLYWQPAVGLSVAQRRTSLERVLPWLTHVHVFHWAKDEHGQRDRRPLAEGRDVWRQYLERLAEHDAQAGLAGEIERYAMIEFVRNDDPEQFLADAEALKELAGVKRGEE